MALNLRRTVEELLQTISYEELIEWADYYAVEPFGEWRSDMRSAQVCAVIANVNRDPKKMREPFAPKDFMMFERAQEKVKDIVAPETRTWFYAMAKKNAA